MINYWRPLWNYRIPMDRFDSWVAAFKAIQGVHLSLSFCTFWDAPPFWHWLHNTLKLVCLTHYLLEQCTLWGPWGCVTYQWIDFAVTIINTDRIYGSLVRVCSAFAIETWCLWTLASSLYFRCRFELESYLLRWIGCWDRHVAYWWEHVLCHVYLVLFLYTSVAVELTSYLFLDLDVGIVILLVDESTCFVTFILCSVFILQMPLN